MLLQRQVISALNKMVTIVNYGAFLRCQLKLTMALKELKWQLSHHSSLLSVHIWFDFGFSSLRSEWELFDWHFLHVHLPTVPRPRGVPLRALPDQDASDTSLREVPPQQGAGVEDESQSHWSTLQRRKQVNYTNNTLQI